MFAVDTTPQRTAPAPHADAATVEKNTSPFFSDGDTSLHPLTATTASRSPSERVSVSPAKQQAAHRSRTTFARTNHAVAVTPAVRTPLKASPSLAGSASQGSYAVPSPVRSILNYYLGVSPSPRRPVDAPNEGERSSTKHSAAALPSSDSSASTSVRVRGSDSSQDDSFHRSPAPARTYMEEFLAAEEDETTAAYPFSALSSTQHGGGNAVGYALDNSPVVKEMWAETSSSTSSSSAASFASTNSNMVEENTAAPFETNSPSSFSSLPTVQTTAARGSARGEEGPQQQRRLPSVERTLFLPPAGTEGDLGGRRTMLSAPLTEAVAVGGPARRASASPIARLLSSMVSPRTHDSEGPTSRVSTGATSLSRLQLLQLSAGAAHRPLPGWTPQRLAAATVPSSANHERDTAYEEMHDGDEIGDEQVPRHTKSAKAAPVLLNPVVGPAATYRDPSREAAAPRPVHHKRNVVARLYPTASSRHEPPSQGEKEDRCETAAAAPRWNVSTRICYDPLTQSIDAAAVISENATTQRRGRAAAADYVAERPGSRPRLRSASARAPSTPPLPTRTTLLRLQALTERKAEEAARLEEELHPSFHPMVAPNSARICQQKLRELSARPLAKNSAAEESCGDAVSKSSRCASLIAASSSQRVRDRRDAQLPPSRPPSARRRSQEINRERRRRSSESDILSVAPSEARKVEPKRSAQRLTSLVQEDTTSVQSLPVDLQQTTPQQSATRDATMMSETLEVQLSPPQHAAEEATLARVDFYSTADTREEAERADRADVLSAHRRVEDRLMALEEDRRRRLYLMRLHADTRDATTGQRLFKPFTGR